MPTATAWLDFERAPSAVRALLFDVDLAVRDKIHRGMRLEWLPRTADGERRLRQQMRVLDRMQAEEIVIEEGPRGTWVKRFVRGPNTGTRFVGRFEEQGNGTRLTLDAFVGPQGFAQGLGKLSPLGLEKAMKRMLGEYKRALEGYEPGRARGAVLAALAQAGREAASIGALEEARRKAVVSTLLETAWSIACVDEPPDEAERDALHAIVAALWRTTLTVAAEQRMVDAAVQAIAREGVAARCDALGARLRSLGYAELGLSLAVLVAEVSRGLDPTEIGALRRLAAAAGIGDEALTAVVRRTDLDLSGGDPLARMSSFV
jgi:hypothetical protein